MDMPTLVSQYIPIERSGGVYQALCPFHKDKDTKSFTVYPKSAHCFGCGRHWGPVGFLMEFLHITRSEAIAKLKGTEGAELRLVKKLKVSNIRVIPLATINTWHGMLKEHREYFHSRLFSDETIDRELWGWTGDRYVVPVWQSPGKCVSVRLRAGSKDMKPKYIGLKGHNPRVLYNLWNVQQYYKSWPENLPKTIFIFFGEFDAALSFQDGHPSISPTNGQNAWDEGWDDLLKEYNIIIVPDKGEELRGFQVASRFPGKASVIQWQEGDYNDYNSFRQKGGTAEEFMCEIVGGAVVPSYSVECYYSEVNHESSNTGTPAYAWG